MLLKAALNGDRTSREHENIPVAGEQLVADVLAAQNLGIHVVHIHPRDGDGSESLRKQDIEPTVAAIRKSCSPVSIGISTGAWIVPDVQARLRCVSEWSGVVEFASVNFSEQGAVEIAHRLLELGVGVEAGLFHAQAAGIFVNSGLAERALRIMFEPVDETVDEALRTVDEIEKTLAEHCVENSSRLLHGYNATAWPLLIEAKRRGYDTRIGFEDTLVLPDGRPASSNAELIGAAKELLEMQQA